MLLSYTVLSSKDISPVKSRLHGRLHVRVTSYPLLSYTVLSTKEYQCNRCWTVGCVCVCMTLSGTVLHCTVGNGFTKYTE